jgi:hypothetical protein
MEPECPRCGSDAAVTSSDAGEGLTAYTCHFSHGGEGSVTWTEARTRAKTVSGRSTRTPKVRSQAGSGDSAAAVNARAIDAFRSEVSRRGGQAAVRRSGNRNEVIVKAPGLVIEFLVSVRSRTSGDFQTSIAYRKARTAEEFPTRFWVFVDLFPEATNFYVVPEWWIQNNILEQHQLYLEAHHGERAVNDESMHHSIDTSRVAPWAGNWKQLGL